MSHLNVSLTRGRRGRLKTVFTAFEENDKPQRNRPEIYPLPVSAAAFRRAIPAHTRPSCKLTLAHTLFILLLQIDNNKSVSVALNPFVILV